MSTISGGSKQKEKRTEEKKGGKRKHKKKKTKKKWTNAEFELLQPNCAHWHMRLHQNVEVCIEVTVRMAEGLRIM